MPKRQKLLIVDDEANIRYSIQTVLSSESLDVIEASTAKEGVQAVSTQMPDVVLLDVKLPDMSGLDAFDKIHAIDARIPVIIMTAYSKTDTAIEAMRRGAFEYFVKPVDFTVLKHAVDRALHVSRLNHIPAVVGPSTDDDPLRNEQIVGNSAAMQEVYKSIGRVAPQDVTVLIQGDSGTGKELVARSIFHYSKRSQKQFLAVNCAALSESLLESELFGHEKGAFTGADSRRIGKFEQVNGGTIFLDEVGDMSPSTQAKALRLLQQQQFERLGGTATIQTDVRIIAATNKDLRSMVQAGTFREDLFYRLNGFTIYLPALRDRKEDVPMLIDYFVRVISQDLSRPIHGITDRAREILQRHDWPGNVRELHSAVRYAIVNSNSGIITEDCLPTSCWDETQPVTSDRPSEPVTTSVSPTFEKNASECQPSEGVIDVRQLVRNLLASQSNDVYREVMHVVDKVIVEEALKESSGNQLLAAERLGISRPTLRSKLRSTNEH